MDGENDDVVVTQEMFDQMDTALGFGPDEDTSDAATGDLPADLGESGDSIGDSKPDQPDKPAVSESSQGGSDSPDTWKPETRAQWGTLPQPVRDEILKRENDMKAGFEQIAKIKDSAGFGETVNKLLDPYRSEFEAIGVHPLQQVETMLQVHKMLKGGTPQGKIAVFREFAKDYGIDITTLAGAPQGEGQESSTVARLQSEVDSLKNTHVQRETAERNQRVAETNQRIQAFREDPANRHYDALVGTMTNLIRAGQAKDLRDAYDQAVWLDPTVREEVLKEKAGAETAAREEASRKAATERAAQAARDRKATSVNVRPTNTQRSGGAANPKTGTVDDTLRETLSRIQGRDG